ncbi:uncharacterized protein LOC129316857 [Prosopis cineraria]|uniref:uncharacterized protein LOC129316857 n=1 Tax=Prosopis cineraria TaxID=364024 RepID=UPI00241065F1|nr:uncharacterized protein LOC129316857 [Prosopis cineraria]
MESSWVSRRRNWTEVLASIIVIITLIEFFPQIDAACSSSCGKITNISHPFRLQGDPKRCGDKNYELQCIYGGGGSGDNDVLVLPILSGEFYVQSINYTFSSIRLVDTNFHDDRSNNCSSLPRYVLHAGNLSSSGIIWSLGYPNFEVIYIKCEREIRDNPYYVSTDPCLSGSHIYAVPGNISFAELEIGCRAVAVTPSKIPMMSSLSCRTLTSTGICRPLDSRFCGVIKHQCPPLT